MESRTALFVAIILKCVLLSDGVGQLPYCKKEIDSVTKHKCYNGTLGGAQVRPAGLKWTIIDSSLGRVKVEFPLLPLQCTEYLATLLVYEDPSLTEDKCLEMNEQNISYFKPHSFRYLSRVNDRAAFGDDPPICTETGSVTFNYIYSGCYTLQVGCRNRSERFRSYVGSYLETEHQKENANYSVRMSFHNFPATLEGDIDIEFGNILEDIGIKVILVNFVEDVPDPCYRTGFLHTCCVIMNEEIECSAKVQNQLKPKCFREQGLIKCMVHNVTEGHYCVMVELFDDRCRAPTASVWNYNKCYYHSKVEVLSLAVSDRSTIIQPLSSEYIVTGMVSSIFIVLCLGVLLYMRMRRTYIRNPGKQLIEETASKGSGELWMEAQPREIEVPSEVVAETCYENTKG